MGSCTMAYRHLFLVVAISTCVYQILDGKRITRQPTTTAGDLTWDKYYRAADIAAFTSALARNNNNVKLIKLGKTYERRPLQALVFSDRKKPKTYVRRRSLGVNDNLNLRATNRRRRSTIRSHKKKPVIIIEAGAHAREWISPAVATYIAQQLASSNNSDLLKHATWVIVPLLNPDGYEYTHTDYRLWRKNRSPNKGNSECPGVDLNRNFKIEWATTGSSSNPCSDVYHGKKAFSEKETKAIKKLLKKFKNVKLYLSLHSYGQIILHPWGYTSDEPPGAEKLKSMANAFSKHISDKGGRTYEVEQAGVSYQSGGGSDDYAYSIGVPYSYTVELPPTWFGADGFEMPPDKILGISQEVWAGLKCLLGDLVPDAVSLC